MDIFFADPSEIPLPPDEVRIRLLDAEPMVNLMRIKVSLELDPFQKRPSLELRLLSPSGTEVASVEVIETMTRKLELNMHLRTQPEPGEYTLSAVLYYTEIPELPSASSSEGLSPPASISASSQPASSLEFQPSQSIPEPESLIQRQVDTAQFRFSL